MWMTVVIALLIAWCVTSVPLALIVARGLRRRPTVPTLAVAPAVHTHDADTAVLQMHRAS